MDDKSSKFVSLKEVVQYSWRRWGDYRAAGLVIASLMILDKLFWLYFSYSFKIAVDGITNEGGSDINRVLMALVFVFPVMVVVNIVNDRMMASVRVKMSNNIRMQMFEHLQRLSLEFYTRSQLGNILSRFAGDIDSIERVISDRFLNSLMSALAVVAYIVVLFYLSWHLTLVTLLILLVMVPLIRRFVPRALAAFYNIRQADAAVINFVQENVRAQPVIKGFGLENRAARMFHIHLEGFADKYIKAFFTSSLIDKVVILVVIYVVLLVASGGALLVEWNVATTGSVVAFLGLLIVLSRDLFIVGYQLEHLFRASGGIRRIEELLRQRPHIVDTPRAVALPGFSTNIRFEDVSFSYNGDTPQLDRIHTTIPVGQYVAIVGPSGAGKSTLLRLLMRFYDVTAGSVTLDGHDVRELTQASLRAHMGIVFQEAFLFDASIRENIGLFDPDVRDEDIEAAARAAEIHHFITSLPQGYHTQTGESGGRLSGGQRQRIAIARALLRDPPILLLDEVTASLDADAASAINATLEKLSGSRTVISVTHNLRQAAQADNILVLDAGQLVECGTHEDLMAQHGLYAQLWASQSKDNGRAVVNEQGARRE